MSIGWYSGLTFDSVMRHLLTFLESSVSTFCIRQKLSCTFTFSDTGKSLGQRTFRFRSNKTSCIFFCFINFNWKRKREAGEGLFIAFIMYVIIGTNLKCNYKQVKSMMYHSVINKTNCNHWQIAVGNKILVTGK